MKIKEATEGVHIHAILDAYHLKPKLRVPQEVRAQDVWADAGVSYPLCFSNTRAFNEHLGNGEVFLYLRRCGGILPWVNRRR
jgi:hypothetical protein